MGRYVNIITGDEVTIEELKMLKIDDFTNPDDYYVVFEELGNIGVIYTGREIIEMVENNQL